MRDSPHSVVDAHRFEMRRLRYMGNTHGMVNGNNLPWELPE